MSLLHELSDEDILEYWYWNWAEGWRIQMKEDGFVVFPEWDDELDDATRRTALVVESRWAPALPDEVPSQLWDGRYVASSQLFVERRAERRAEVHA